MDERKSRPLCLSGDLARPGVGAAHKLHLGFSAVGVSPEIERISVECARSLIGAAFASWSKNSRNQS
jgi:hypothetical protein